MDDYFGLVEKYYGGKVTKLDFANETEKSRLTINSWVEGQTDNKIKDLRQIEEKYEGKSYAEFKTDLAEIVIESLKPFQKKYNELKKDMGFVESVLTKSEENARILASTTLHEVKERMGLE